MAHKDSRYKKTSFSHFCSPASDAVEALGLQVPACVTAARAAGWAGLWFQPKLKEESWII